MPSSSISQLPLASSLAAATMFEVANAGVSERTVLSTLATAVATQLNIASGTYTPTITAITNVAASTAYVSQYFRVGSVVTVSGKVDIDPTAASHTVFGISLPIASALTAGEQLAGTGAQVFGGGEVKIASILADPTNDRAQCEFVPQDTANRPLSFHFTYRVL